jgi:ABC-type branched-subunit amino acid transport system permease subunit
MIHKNTLRYSLYVTAGLIILTLTGVFGVFEGRVIIEDQLDFDTVVLTLMLGATAFTVALPAMEEFGAKGAILNSLIGSLVVGVSLAILVLLVDIDVERARFMFANLTDSGLNSGTLTFGETVSASDGEFGGLFLLLLFSGVVGVVVGLLVVIPKRLRDVLIISTGLTMILGLTVDQVNSVITLPDALVLVFVFVAAYTLGWRMTGTLGQHLAAGFGIGAAIGAVLAVIANNGGLEDGGILRGIDDMPIFLEMTIKGWWLVSFLVIMGLFGAAGTLISGESRNAHNGAFYFITALLLMGILNWQDEMTLLAAGLLLGLMSVSFWFTPKLGERTEASFETISRQERKAANGVFFIMAVVVMMVAPQFLGPYLSNVFNLIALYAIMGIGLNILVGYAGLLDLGYVAAFAIGAYTLGLLTTPSLLTCGGADPRDIPFLELQETCTGTLDFWLALPFSVAFSALAGMMLGIPVLRLRGDYLAIVTLGFGEIINRIIKSDSFKPLLGGPGGIPAIPSPKIDVDFTGVIDLLFAIGNSTNIYYLLLFGVVVTIFVVRRLTLSGLGRAQEATRADEDTPKAVGIALVKVILLFIASSAAFVGIWALIARSDNNLVVDFSKSTNIYYLFLLGAITTAFVVHRLSSSRLGRAWRAIRADENVAQAMGIELVRTKLWAFAISAAFAGFGGALFAGMLQGVFPDSFTLMVSINVLSLIIIGGMGSIPGVLVGSLLLVGLPELLRELQEYRMLAFGILLVTVMLVKSEGLLPPKPAKLSERVVEKAGEEEKHYA